jgi:cyclic pyranopterin phosphate synthase
VSAESANRTGKELHQFYEEQLLEMKEEREHLFGFTEADHSAWSNAGSDHRHDGSFLEEVNAARRRREDHYEAQVTSAMFPSSRGESGDELFGGTSNDLRETELETVTSGAAARQPFSHVSEDGTSVQMVDVGGKAVTQRVAVAQTRVVFPPEVVEAFRQQGDDLIGKKGPIFATAKIAGIMAAKYVQSKSLLKLTPVISRFVSAVLRALTFCCFRRTSELIPLCHPLPLDKVHIDIRMYDSTVAVIQCECRVSHKTGVEMEALTGATVAALTVYDMVKAVSHRVRIEDTVLLAKSGGKRDVS